MKQKMPIGIDDFQKLRENNYYFVDKTDFIRQIIDGHSEVTLITRPRRFGKTITMSMLEWFFSIEKKEQSQNLFTGLHIERAGKNYMQYQGNYPVLYLSLKDFNALNWRQMQGEWQIFLRNLFLRHEKLQDAKKVQTGLIEQFQAIASGKAGTEALATALALILQIMHQYYGKKVILLLDEYDAPVEQAWENGFYKEAIAFMKQFLGSALKSNPDLDFAVLTGVLRVAKESIFSGLNNLDVCTVMSDTYADVFGFTPQEVEQMAGDLSLTSQLPEIQHWYDGYRFGQQEIYNPWSVINFFAKGYLDDYWVNTSENGIIQQMLNHLTEEREQTLRSLLEGESISTAIREGVIYDDIDRDEDTLYTMLLTTGYLTIVNRRRGIGGWMCELRIPNREVQDVYRVEILDRMKAGLSISRLEQMLNALIAGKTSEFTNRLSTYIRYLVSSYDAANKESFYHGFLLGMTALLVPQYVVESNRESGYGRFDLAIFPKDTKRAGVIMEFKVATREAELQGKAEEALQQIEAREYVTEFQKRGIKNVWKYGIAFCGKKIAVANQAELSDKTE